MNRWAAVASLSFGSFVLVTTEFLPIGLLSPIASELGVSEGTAGWMVTVPGLTAAIAAPASAWAFGRVDRKGLLLVMTTLVCTSNLISAWSSLFPMMLTARLLLGIAVGSFWAFAAAVGRRLVDADSGGTATAVVLAGISAGTILGLPMGTTIGNWAGWRAAFEISAGLAFVALAAQAALLPRLPAGMSTHDDAWLALRSNRALRSAFAIAAIVVFGHFAAYTYSEPFLRNGLGMMPAQISIVLLAYGTAGLVGNVAAARVAERHARITLSCVLVLMCLSVLTLAWRREADAIALAAVIGWGIAFGAVPTTLQAWLFQASPRLYEASSAVMVTVFQCALAAGAWVGGRVADAHGIRSTLLFGTAAIAAGAVATLLLQSIRSGDVNPFAGR